MYTSAAKKIFPLVESDPSVSRNSHELNKKTADLIDQPPDYLFVCKIEHLCRTDLSPQFLVLFREPVVRITREGFSPKMNGP